MSEYPSIKNLYASNGLQNADRRTGPEFGFNMPEVDLIRRWLVLDKLDGMNMRVSLNPAEHSGIKIAGRTDNAQIPGDLIESIKGWATLESFERVFSYDVVTDMLTLVGMPDEVVLYGEGIGGKIQGNSAAYGNDKRFVLFDVTVDGKWLDWSAVVDIAWKLGLDLPYVYEYAADLDYVLERMEEERHDGLVEGFILRTDPYVFDWRGNRVMAKYKLRDLPKTVDPYDPGSAFRVAVDL